MSDLQMMKGGPFTEKRLLKWLQEDGRVVVQFKRDEFRCDVVVHTAGDLRGVTYSSAQGKPLHNLDAFDTLFLQMAEWSGQQRFDMGVCVNDSFDLTRRTLRASTKPYDLTGQTVQTIAGKTKQAAPHYVGPLRARFWLYDLPGMESGYPTRRVEMASLHHNWPQYTALPETEVLTTVEQVQAAFEKARELGHEGLMVKRYEHNWEPSRRPDSWMKMKPSDEVDGRIVDFAAGKGKYTGMIGSLICEAEDGTNFTISGMTDAERAEFTAHFDEYRGKWVTATYMERDTQGGYRHPQFDRLHAEKNL